MSFDAEMTASLWCMNAADHAKVMDLTKDERCDWSNGSVMIETNQSWQTDAHPKLLFKTWTDRLVEEGRNMFHPRSG